MSFLNLILRLNAASSLIFGLLFIFHSETVAKFLGSAPALLILIIGIVLTFNGLHLSLAALRKKIITLEVWYFSFGDLLWVTITIWLVALGVFITTPAGILAALLVAIGVGTFGLLQLNQLGQLDRAQLDHNIIINPSDHISADLSLWSAIGHSWLAMKLWIKIWLFILNVVFIFAVFFLPDLLAIWTLAAYLITGPWLIGIMIAQRGITRFLGLGHIIAWIPLLIYVTLRLISSLAGPQITFFIDPYLFVYAIVLWLTITICLIFDFYDLWRWLAGEHFRIGSLSANQVGASSLAPSKTELVK